MRIPSFLACLLLAMSPAHGQAPVPARAVLTLAEQPLRLIRGAALYRAPAGIAVQNDDILETGVGAAQVEAGPGAIVALGPHTRVLVLDLPQGGKSLQVALLQGWVKLVASNGKPARIVSPTLQLALSAGSAIVASGAGPRDAVFAEEGAQQVARVEKGRVATALKLAAEQYAEVDPAKPLAVAARPARAFIAAMPPAFRDRLATVPNTANAGKVAPVREGEADFADVEPWLVAQLPGVKPFVARFRPRLADPVFRRQLERSLGRHAAWQAVLHPARPRASTLF